MQIDEENDLVRTGLALLHLVPPPRQPPCALKTWRQSLGYSGAVAPFEFLDPRLHEMNIRDHARIMARKCIYQVVVSTVLSLPSDDSHKHDY